MSCAPRAFPSSGSRPTRPPRSCRGSAARGSRTCSTSPTPGCCGRRGAFARSWTGRAAEAHGWRSARHGRTGPRCAWASKRSRATSVIWACGAWLGRLFPDLRLAAGHAPASRAVPGRDRVVRSRMGRLRRSLVRTRRDRAPRLQGRPRRRRSAGGPRRTARRGWGGHGPGRSAVPRAALPGPRGRPARERARLPLQPHRGLQLPLRSPPGPTGRVAARRRLGTRVQARPGRGGARSGRAGRPRALPSHASRSASAGRGAAFAPPERADRRCRDYQWCGPVPRQRDCSTQLQGPRPGVTQIGVETLWIKGPCSICSRQRPLPEPSKR